MHVYADVCTTFHELTKLLTCILSVIRSTPLTDARQSASDRGMCCKSTHFDLDSHSQTICFRWTVVHVCGSKLGGQDKIGHGDWCQCWSRLTVILWCTFTKSFWKNRKEKNWTNKCFQKIQKISKKKQGSFIQKVQNLTKNNRNKNWKLKKVQKITKKVLKSFEKKKKVQKNVHRIKKLQMHSQLSDHVLRSRGLLSRHACKKKLKKAKMKIFKTVTKSFFFGRKCQEKLRKSFQNTKTKINKKLKTWKHLEFSFYTKWEKEKSLEMKVKCAKNVQKLKNCTRAKKFKNKVLKK